MNQSLEALAHERAIENDRLRTTLGQVAIERDAAKSAVKLLLLAHVGPCFHGVPEDEEESVTERCPEPAVYGILTGWSCAAHRRSQDVNVIGGEATLAAMRVLGIG